MWMNTGFNYAVYPTDEHLGVGLEWYLGADHPIVSTLASGDVSAVHAQPDGAGSHLGIGLSRLAARALQ